MLGFAALTPTYLEHAARFAGIPFETAERSARLFAQEVMPVLRTWTQEQGPKKASAAA